MNAHYRRRCYSSSGVYGDEFDDCVSITVTEFFYSVRDVDRIEGTSERTHQLS